METVKISLSQVNAKGENSFFASANIQVVDLLDCAKNCASFCKETDKLVTTLSSNNVKGLSSMRIKKSHKLTLSVIFEDDTNLTVKIANFGQFLNNSEQSQVETVFNALLEYRANFINFSIK